jgi:hypothetical protein
VSNLPSAIFIIDVSPTCGFESRQGGGNFFLTTEFRTALGPTQPPIQWVPGALSLEIRWPGREADHSLPSSVEVKMSGAIPPLPNTPSSRGAELKESTGTSLPLPLYHLTDIHEKYSNVRQSREVVILLQLQNFRVRLSLAHAIARSFPNTIK